MMSLPDLEWVRSARRSLELRVLADGQVQVRTPWHTSREDMEAFVRSKARWLNRTLSSVQARQPRPSRPRFQPGALHCLLGNVFPLRFVDAGRARVRFERDGWRVELPQSQWHDQTTVETLLDHWYRQAARPVFDNLLDRHFPFFAERGFERPVLTIRHMTSRWGSMSRRGRLTLNSELLKYPMPLIEYVVVHELCHLQHMNHGPQFKALQSQLLPDWQQRRQQLNAGTEIYFGDNGSAEN